MAIVAEMADIFTGKTGMTPDEIMILETVLLDIADLALYAGQFGLAIDTQDALLDLHALKLSRLPGGSVLKFWERQLSQTGG